MEGGGNFLWLDGDCYNMLKFILSMKNGDLYRILNLVVVGWFFSSRCFC